jgi:hypothetical protein
MLISYVSGLNITWRSYPSVNFPVYLIFPHQISSMYLAAGLVIASSYLLSYPITYWATEQSYSAFRRSVVMVHISQ